jgi:hypothetical protein
MIYELSRNKVKRMTKNYINELDFILSSLINEYANINEGVKFYQGEAPKTTKETVTETVIKKYGLKEWEINVLFHHLLIDKYIISIDPLTISMEGVVFESTGGYAEKNRREELEKIRINTIEGDLKKYSYGLMVFTGVVAIGTLISALYFVLEMWKLFN